MQDAPSTTARKVAINVVMLAEEPRTAALLPDGAADTTARLLRGANIVSEPALRFARTKSARALMYAFDWMMPGQFESFARRKQFCEEQVRRAIGSGATQVLELGAGYDTLCWRLAGELDEVRFYEIDHPATSRAKAKGVEALGPRDNLHLVAEDLAERRLPDVLAEVPQWDVGATSVVIAEGLLMYLPEPAVRDLFAAVAASSGPDSRIVFSHVGVDAEGHPDAGPWPRLTQWSLRLIGEPWRWGYPPAELDDFLGPCGWTVDVPPERAGIEYLTVAKRNA
jgi:methyltransferase (TIGR00027 family)